MPPTVKAALAYVLPVFALAFAFGVLRVTLIAPRTGPLPAVALELPLVLALSWAVAGRVLARWPDSRREGLGLIAFAFAVFSVTFLGEKLTMNHAVGFALIVGGAWFIFRGPL